MVSSSSFRSSSVLHRTKGSTRLESSFLFLPGPCSCTWNNELPQRHSPWKEHRPLTPAGWHVPEYYGHVQQVHTFPSLRFRLHLRLNKVRINIWYLISLHHGISEVVYRLGLGGVEGGWIFSIKRKYKWKTKAIHGKDSENAGQPVLQIEWVHNLHCASIPSYPHIS